MSETLPANNPRLANFEANKAAREKDQWEQDLYADAGVNDFSDEAKTRVEEADAYERHMEALAARDKAYTPFDDLENQPSAGYEAEVEAAYAENEAFDAQQAATARDQKAHDRALSQALEDKFAGDPKLRFMNTIAAEIADLRHKHVAEDTAERDIRRMSELEDRLQELLLEYAERPDYDPAIADILMDETDTAALEQAAEHALRDQSEQAEPAEAPASTTPEVDEPEQADEAEKAEEAKEAAQLSESETETQEMPAVAAADDDAAGERPVIKQQKTADELMADGVVDGEHPALEGESLEEYEARQASKTEPNQGEADAQAAAREALEYQERGQEASDDTEKTPRKARLSKFRSWLSGVRQKGSLQSIKAYNAMMDGFGKIGDKVSARKPGELDEDYEYRKKRNGVLATALGAVALGMAVKYGVDTLGNSSGGTMTTTPDMPASTPDTNSDTFPSPEQVVPTSSTETGADWSDAARTADSGEGWYQTFQDMNIPQQEWHDLLEKVGPELEQSGYAYQMDDGSYGINRAGALPAEALELIERNR